MPYKCSVKHCRSNFDSTTEKVTVFSFPKDELLLRKWLHNVQLKTSNITKSSRICIKHFSPDDIADNNFRKILKSTAVPQKLQPTSDDESEIKSEQVIEDDDLDFPQLCKEIGQKYSQLRLLIDTSGMCIYDLRFNEDFTDVIMSTKIIVNKDMHLRVVHDGSESVCEELRSLPQLVELIEFYFELGKHQEMSDDVVVDEEHSIIEEDVSNESDQSQFDTNDERNVEEQELFEDDLIEYVNPLQCENCSISFLNQLGLQHHMRTCQLPKKISFMCRICDENFSSTLQLKLHQRKMHASVNKIKCHLCSIILVNTASLNRHLNAVHFQMRPHKCSICNKSFATASTRNAHEKTHETNVEMEQFLNKYDNGLYCCPNCGEKFAKSHQLRNHLEKNCYLPRKRRIYKYPCKFCDKQFSTKIKAAEHSFEQHGVKIENPQKFCFECNTEVQDYGNHIRIHTCQYSCAYCGLKFLTEETCRQHEITKHPEPDSEIRPYSCSFCSISFKNEYRLRAHVASFHAQTEREYQCDLCKNQFTTKSLLNAHMRTHEKSATIFSCKLCKKGFKKLLNLKNHSLAVHQTDEIYSCELDDCRARYKLLQELKVHQQLDHGVNLNIQKYFNADK